MTEQAVITARIQKGKAVPLADRQERWDRITAWSKSHSLSEMVTMERELQEARRAAGLPHQADLSRERVRQIDQRASPGIGRASQDARPPVAGAIAQGTPHQVATLRAAQRPRHGREPDDRARPGPRRDRAEKRRKART